MLALNRLTGSVIGRCSGAQLSVAGTIADRAMQYLLQRFIYHVAERTLLLEAYRRRSVVL